MRSVMLQAVVERKAADLSNTFAPLHQTLTLRPGCGHPVRNDPRCSGENRDREHDEPTDCVTSAFSGSGLRLCGPHEALDSVL